MNKEKRVWTVLTMLEWATQYFEEKNVPDPRLSIEWIVAEALGIKRLDLYLQFDRPLSSEELAGIRPLVKRRAAFEPLQYITGSTSFVNVTISVSPDVLIPRIETEQLVDLLLGDYAENIDASLSLLDLGTGSGCIPIAIKKERPAWYCAGSDLSAQALEIARKNADENDTDVYFFEADMAQLAENETAQNRGWDIVISNPPYITDSEKKEMNPQVLRYEPHLALFHNAPLELYRKIIAFAHKKKAALYLECNNKTAQKVEGIASQFFSRVELFNDLDDNPRFVRALSPLIK